MIYRMGCCWYVRTRPSGGFLCARILVVQSAVLRLGKLQVLLGNGFGGFEVSAPEGDLPGAKKIQVEAFAVAPLFR